MMQKLAALFRLEREERRLLLAGLIAMPVVRAALLFSSPQRIASAMARLNERFPRAAAAPGVNARAAARRLSQAARYCPLPVTCLAEALAGRALMTRYGHASELCIGVLKSGGKLEAHAWLECPGEVVVGNPRPRGREYVRLPEIERLIQ